MIDFEFYSVGRIVFGCGQFKRIGELIAPFGKSALIIHNGGELGGGGVVDRLAHLLKSAGARASFIRQRGEPTTLHVDAAVKHANEQHCDVIIGLGGGSAIDCAKAVAGLLGNGGSALDYMEVVGAGRKITRPAIPWIAIPTTAGTGAEVTRNAVIGFPEKQFKASIRSELLLPRVALVDPELAVAISPDVTARCGMDALCQLIESFTSTGAGPNTDGLAIRGIGLAAVTLVRAYENGADLEARSNMALAALLSGITLTNAGLGAVHGFAAPLGALLPIPHGTICAALLWRVLDANIAALRAESSNHPTLLRYAQIGRTLADEQLAVPPAIDACVSFTRELNRRLKIPALGQFGLNEKLIPQVVALSKNSSSMRFNPVKLSDETMGGILYGAKQHASP